MILQLAQGLRALGVEVTLATMQQGWMTERAEEYGLPVWIEPQRPGIDLRWVARMRRRFVDEGIDLFHGHEFEMNAYGGIAARLAGIPSVATLHGVMAGVSPKHLMAYRVLGALGQRPIAVSQELWNELAPRIGAAPRSPDVIRNGTQVPPLMSPAERDERRAAARREIGLSRSGALLVAIGNLYPVKDHATLIRAVADLPDVQVAIAGRGEEEDNLRLLAQELGVADRIHLLGLRSDVSRLLTAADLFVHPSRSEGLPLAILEAMAAQTPIVASRVGGIPEALDEGEMGALVAPGQPANLGREIAALLADPEKRNAFVRAAWQRAADRFSVESMARGYLEVYHQVLR